VKGVLTVGGYTDCFVFMHALRLLARYCGNRLAAGGPCHEPSVNSSYTKSVRLRDTFAGKIISETRGVQTDSEKVPNFYRQKCRAGVRTKLLFMDNCRISTVSF